MSSDVHFVFGPFTPVVSWLFGDNRTTRPTPRPGTGRTDTAVAIGILTTLAFAVMGAGFYDLTTNKNPRAHLLRNGWDDALRYTAIALMAIGAVGVGIGVAGLILGNPVVGGLIIAAGLALFLSGGAVNYASDSKVRAFEKSKPNQDLIKEKEELEKEIALFKTQQQQINRLKAQRTACSAKQYSNPLYAELKKEHFKETLKDENDSGLISWLEGKITTQENASGLATLEARAADIEKRMDEAAASLMRQLA